MNKRARSLLLGATLLLGGPSARAQNVQVLPAQKQASPAPALVPLNQGTSPQAVTGATGAAGATGASGTTAVMKQLPAPPVQKFGRFELDQPLSLLAQLPDLKTCAPLFATPTGHAECALGANDEKLAKVNLSNQVKGKPVKPAGEWNTFEINCKGKDISVWVNGSTTCEWHDCQALRGYVGLEAEGYRIEFRKVMLKEL